MEKEKMFLTYEEQIEFLKKKNLKIFDEQTAVKTLKRYGYYSLISGYKDIFKTERGGNYRDDSCFEYIVKLYLFDDTLRNLTLDCILAIERNIKSLYAYSFCQLFGCEQSAYQNANNYNYCNKNQDDINEFLSIVQSNLKSSQKYPYITHYIQKYNFVPLWVFINSLTLGNVSKLYNFSLPKIQSTVAKNFNEIYSKELCNILNILTKFRNVCAHGERLYNYRTKNAMVDLPIHSSVKGKHSISKNDLFNVFLSFGYLIDKTDYRLFYDKLTSAIDMLFVSIPEYYQHKILESMGFPDDWRDILNIYDDTFEAFKKGVNLL